MSLDVDIIRKSCEHCGRSDDMYTANITHNLGNMAMAAGIYEALWRPYMLHDTFVPFGEGEYEKEYNYEESVTMYAKDIIPKLKAGLRRLKRSPEKYKKFNSENGWGMYEHFVPFVAEYLKECEKDPEAKIEVSR